MGHMTFLGDEGRDALVVYNILHGNLTLLGPTASVGGFFLGPIYYYFMAPFLWLFNYSPVGPAIMVALFGIATVWLIYKVGKEFFGSTVGLIAAGLYSISPLVVTYSRSSWNPNLMPFFSLLILYLIYKAVKGNSIRLFTISGILLGVALQLHYLTLFLGVIIFFYIFLQKSIRKFYYIFLGFIVGWSPFLAFEVRHGFLNIKSIFNFIFHSGNTGGNNNFYTTISNVFFRIFGRLVGNFPSPEKITVGQYLGISLWYYLILILGILSVGFLIYKVMEGHKLKSPDFAKTSLLLIWFIFGIGLFGFYKKPIYDYYFGFMFPLPFLIVGFFLKGLWQKNIGKIISILIVLVLVWLNNLTPPFKASVNGQLNQAETIARFVIDKTGNKPFNFALMTGGNSDHTYRYFFTVWQKEPIAIQNVANDPKRETVTDQLFIVCETAECHPLGNSLWEVAGFGRAEIVNEWSVSVVKVFKLRHYSGK